MLIKKKSFNLYIPNTAARTRQAKKRHHPCLSVGPRSHRCCRSMKPEIQSSDGTLRNGPPPHASRRLRCFWVTIETTTTTTGPIYPSAFITMYRLGKGERGGERVGFRYIALTNLLEPPGEEHEIGGTKQSTMTKQGIHIHTYIRTILKRYSHKV